MDIPEESLAGNFHSAYLEGPFRNCTRCGETLVDFDDGYHIGKVFDRGECIFEHALCHSCHQALINEMSDESRQRLLAFHEERLKLNFGLERCGTCGVRRDGVCSSEYAIGGLFRGMGLLHAMMICGACQEEMSHLLSKKTREVWERYINENFPGLPADALPDPSRLVFV
jgi:hypothetical protein